MYIEDVETICNGILLRHKNNEFESVLVKWMNLEPIIQSEVNQKEKKPKYINTYIWNLEKLYLWTYLQRRNKDTNVENWLVDIVTAGVSGTNGESHININVVSCVKWIVGEKLLYNTKEHSLWWPRGMEWEENREAQEGGIYV